MTGQQLLHIGGATAVRSSGRYAVDWPLDAVTETFGIFGQRGSGKTTTAKVFVEELTRLGQQCVVIDPLGVWWGLKANAAGNGPGYPFTILGGLHADVPINDRAGALVADLVLNTTAPLVIDLSQIRKAEGRRFMAAFVDQLWHRASGKPVHVVVDECDLYAPMRPIKGAEALLGGMEDLVRRGRNRGLGSTMISQRPASVHTDIRSQVSVLIAHRLGGVHDRAALDAWVEAHGTRERRSEMMAQLASLPTGTAWMWSPQFLDLFAQVAVRRPTTFDSSATPKAGEKRVEPTQLAQADIAALTTKMADIVAEAEANDPKVLRRQIRELEAALAVRAPEPSAEPEVVEVERIVTVQVIPPAFTDHLDRVRVLLEGTREAILGMLDGWPKFDPNTAVGTPDLAPIRAPAPRTAPNPAVEAPHPPPARPKRPPPADGGLSKAEAALLNVLVQFPDGRNKSQLSFLSGYSARSSSFSNALSTLRSKGLVERSTDPLLATAAARDAIVIDPLPTGPALLDYWMARLGRAERTLMLVILEAWPDDLNKVTLAERSEYSATSSSFSNALSTLRKLDMVERGTIRAADDFAKATR